MTAAKTNKKLTTATKEKAEATKDIAKKATPATKKTPAAKAPTAAKAQSATKSVTAKKSTTKAADKKVTPPKAPKTKVAAKKSPTPPATGAKKVKASKAIKPTPRTAATIAQADKSSKVTAAKLDKSRAAKKTSKAKEEPAAAKTPKTVKARKSRFGRTDLQQFKEHLLAMRERITGQSGSLKKAALQRTDEINPEEDGTDAFMRLQTLGQLSKQQRNLADIDDALRFIEEGTYGVCEICSGLISKPRLEAQPFATTCIKCQAELERSKRLRSRW